MHFQLSDESIMIRDMVRKFAQNEIEPIAAETDRTHEFPMGTFKKLADLGLTGIPCSWRKLPKPAHLLRLL